MSTQALTKTGSRLPAIFDDFFRPWNEWFDGDNGMPLWPRAITIPAVNISENKDAYLLSLAVPGMKKEDFVVKTDGNMLTISSEKETMEEKNDKYTRKEYSYSSFSRSFTLPEDVNRDKVAAIYEEGVLKVTLPRKEEAKAQAREKSIVVK
jgi:HSP20 family protein